MMQDVTNRTINVFQGELAVSAEDDVVLAAVLGSCIATCLWDARAAVGGMNHILLPGRHANAGTETKYGLFAMEALINELMKCGARKTNLQAKVFGGAQTFENAMGIGIANATFVREFLDNEGIPIRAESVGGTKARRIRFQPTSGRARQMLSSEPIFQALPAPGARRHTGTRAALPAPKSGQVELF